jgi:hypothetical protein
MIPEHIARLAEGVYLAAFPSKKASDLWHEPERVTQYYVRNAYGIEEHLNKAGYEIRR